VQVSFPITAPNGTPAGRWVTPALSAQRSVADEYAIKLYVELTCGEDPKPQSLRVISERDLFEEEGVDGVERAYADLLWYVERDADRQAGRQRGVSGGAA
jgi:hypothetical protein